MGELKTGPLLKTGDGEALPVAPTEQVLAIVLSQPFRIGNARPCVAGRVPAWRRDWRRVEAMELA